MPSDLFMNHLREAASVWSVCACVCLCVCAIFFSWRHVAQQLLMQLFVIQSLV